MASFSILRESAPGELQAYSCEWEQELGKRALSDPLLASAWWLDASALRMTLAKWMEMAHGISNPRPCLKRILHEANQWHAALARLCTSGAATLAARTRHEVSPPYAKDIWNPMPAPSVGERKLVVATHGWWELVPPSETSARQLCEQLRNHDVDVCVISGLPAEGLQGHEGARSSAE